VIVLVMSRLVASRIVATSHRVVIATVGTEQGHCESGTQFPDPLNKAPRAGPWSPSSCPGLLDSRILVMRLACWSPSRPTFEMSRWKILRNFLVPLFHFF
jgi:hypothetical protein